MSGDCIGVLSIRGQAAGLAAAIAVKTDREVAALNGTKVYEELESPGAGLFTDP
jgi:hypothetical protein